MLIASEGDERLAQLVNYADAVTLVFAGTLLLAPVLLGAEIRSSLKRKVRMHLLLNVSFFLFLVSAAVAYYAAYLKLNPAVVRLAMSHRFAEAHIPAAPHGRLVALTEQRAREALVPPAELRCFYPGCPARLLPLVLIPAAIICRKAVLRRNAA